MRNQCPPSEELYPVAVKKYNIKHVSKSFRFKGMQVRKTLINGNVCLCSARLLDESIIFKRNVIDGNRFSNISRTIIFCQAMALPNACADVKFFGFFCALVVFRLRRP